MDSEKTPLVSNGTVGRNGAKNGKSNGYHNSGKQVDVRKGKAQDCVMTVLLFQFVAVLVALIFWTTRRSFMGEQMDTVELVPFRPVCQSYAKNAKVIQTSLGEPSQHWTPVVCERQDGWFAPQPKEYKVPDAALKIGTIAHKDRSLDIMGFGGAFTEASALNFESLSQEGKEAVIDLLYGADGLGYTMGRVHINSCDFSVKSYTFDDTDGDFELKDFDMEVTHDVQSGMIGMMIDAIAELKESWGDDLRIFASPWSPPAWLKAPTPDDANGTLHAKNMSGSAEPVCLRDGALSNSSYAQTWALYFSKFLTAYQDHGVDLFAVTIQNEPEFSAPWEACAYNKKTESEFLAYHLGPQLRETHPDVKILIFDHNRDHAPAWINYLLNESNPASQYVDGTAVHWYAGGMQRLLDGAQGAPNMHRAMQDLTNMGHKSDHIILGSEACHCPTTGYAGGSLDVSWSRAERYAHSILADLAAGSNAWVEWNLILDSIGGPNHLGNLCDSSILAVPHRAKGADGRIPSRLDFEHSKPWGRIVGDDLSRDELHARGVPVEYLDVGVVVQPLYYYMGHISRHVRPGSRALKGLVDGTFQSSGKGQIFRPAGQTVAGGGINDLALDGIEVTVWPCEGSTRQEFFLSDDGHLLVKGHDWVGNPIQSCVQNKPDEAFKGLMIDSCKKHAGTFVVDEEWLVGSSVTLRLTNGNKTDEECLLVEELQNDGGAYGSRGGAQVSLGDCQSEQAKWIWDKEKNEFTSAFFGADEKDIVCMTTGWPFLQMGAFETPSGDRVVIILNEATASANYILTDTEDKEKLLLTGSIPPRSIQTVTLS